MTFPLYTGGFLGPFGGAMLIALIPNVAEGLDTSLALVAGAITVYMVPFAVLQLVSGTLANRLGPRRVVRAGYLVFGGAALVCAFAPSIWVFLAGRALMGAANAFLSPILLAALSEVVAPEVLGRSVGTFAAWQAAGVTFAPAIGGALGEVSWRLAFVLVAVVAAVLALPRHSLGAIEERQPGEGGLRSLANRWIALLGAKAMLGYLGFTAIGFVVVLVADREFGLSSGTRGVLVAGYGLGAIALGRYAGSAVDRIGRPRTALAGAIACTAGVLGLAFAPNAWSLALVYLAVGCASAFTWAGLNTITVESFPGNRAGRSPSTAPSSSPGSRSRRSSTSLSSTSTRGRRSISPRASRSWSPCSSCPGSHATRGAARDPAPSDHSRARPGSLLPLHAPPPGRARRRRRVGSEQG
ncbi:MAG: MFS transporter [Gaiellaceae bacterium]